jgi:DNA processing protein
MAPDAGTAWLRLALTPGIGATRARALLDAFGDVGAIFRADEHRPGNTAGGSHRARLSALCGTAAAAALLEPADGALAIAIERSAQWLAVGGSRSLICLTDVDYPAALLQLADAPVALFAQGRRELLGGAGLAIVGSRNATRQGSRNAAAFAANLGRAGLVILSGLAAGIDAAAHEGALDAGAATVAVLGTGIDIVYPRGNAALTARIAAEGLLLSEFAAGEDPLPFHFPRRNRLIAALARGVLVVEAAPHSGSLITARLAADLGREVFAIPGSIHSPLSRGCHQLLRDGAKLVETAQDVLEELRWGPAPPAPGRRVAGATRAVVPDSALLVALGHDPADIDTLAARLGEDAGTVAAQLLELELVQQVERLPGNRYQRLA